MSVSPRSVTCSECSSLYHRSCVALGLGVEVPDWNCGACRAALARARRPPTPETGFSAAPEGCLGAAQLNTTATNDTVESELAMELRLLREELRAMRCDIQCCRSEIGDLKSSITQCTTRLNVLDTKVALLEQNMASSKSSTNLAELERVVAQLQSDINERDQALLSNDVELTNISEMPGENLPHLMLVVATSLGVKLEERDVISASRVGAHQLRVDDPAGPTPLRPRPIAVRLSNPALKKELLQGARVRRGATTTDLGLSTPPRRFYVNERLTKLNRILFRRAREAGRGNGWRFVWTKGGRIFARRDEGSPVRVIKCEEDVKKYIDQTKATT